MELQSPENLFKTKQLHDAFNRQLHVFSVTLITYYPLSKFLTKKGYVSALTMDISNTEKQTIDCFFITKYSDPKFLSKRVGWEKALYGSLSEIHNISHDDTYMTDMRSLKRPTSLKKAYQEVLISIVPLKSIL